MKVSASEVAGTGTAAHPWSRFVAAFLAASGALCATLFLAVFGLDPYGLRAGPGRAPTPIMDLNQRYMYPQIVRGRRFDSATFGTSTIRLLDPRRLDGLLGGRFANLGLNAGTPWEQMQLAELFLRETPRPRTLIFGLDLPWCEADADRPEKRLTFRSFPPWLYDESPVNDWPELLSLQSVEVAARVALNRLGLLPERIRGDGFEVFVPPEDDYDPFRAAVHIWGGRPPLPPVEPPVRLTAEEQAAERFPALAWLDELMGRAPAGTRLIVTFMPIHQAAQMRAGSREQAVDELCKQRAAAIAKKHGAVAVDFRFRSPLTTTDTNYWDPLHVRLPVAARTAEALARAALTGGPSPDGSYRVLTPAAAN